METITRKRRKSDTPTNGASVIKSPNKFDLAACLALDPFLRAKYATTSWLYYDQFGTVPLKKQPDNATPEDMRRLYHYQWFSRKLGLLRQTQNSFLEWPQEQRRIENYLYKDAVYCLAERGMSALVEKQMAVERSHRKSGRFYPYAPHRSKHFPHELGVDLTFTWPLRYALDHCGTSARALRLPALLQHEAVPEKTRKADNPFTQKMTLTGEMTLDPAPVVICVLKADHTEENHCIPGIQYDRGTKSNKDMEHQIDQACEYVDGKYYETQWGFDTCVIPFFFTNRTRMQYAMDYLAKKPKRYGSLIFKHVADPYVDDFFQPLGDETITSAFLCVGKPDYYLLKPSEK